nr:hypothetical protein [uncultured Flavobacterium sp.]
MQTYLIGSNNKATVTNTGNELVLYSYLTEVAKIQGDACHIYDWYSQTTAKHINLFLEQNGFKKVTKKDIQGGAIITKNS